MSEFDYLSERCLDDVGRAIERRRPLTIRITGKIAARAARAMRHRDAYFLAREEGSKDRGQLLLFGWYGMRTPLLWALLNEADLEGGTVCAEMQGQDLLVRISFP